MNIIKKFEQFNFYPDIASKKKTWYLLDNKEVLKVSDDVIELVQTAYKNTQDGSHINSKDDMLRSTDWFLIDWDELPDVDAVIFGRKTKFGVKVQGIGHDGDPISKDLVINKLVNILKKSGYYIESSHKVENILYKNDVPYIKSEDLLNSIYPNSNLKMIGDKGKYTRELQNGRIINETTFGKIKTTNY